MKPQWHYHPESILYITVLSWWCTFYGIGQVYNAMYPLLWYHTEYLTALKILCAPPIYKTMKRFVWICTLFLHSGHANLLCISLILLYVLPKRALNFFLWGKVKKAFPSWKSALRRSDWRAAKPAQESFTLHWPVSPPLWAGGEITSHPLHDPAEDSGLWQQFLDWNGMDLPFLLCWGQERCFWKKMFVSVAPVLDVELAHNKRLLD